MNQFKVGIMALLAVFLASAASAQIKEEKVFKVTKMPFNTKYSDMAPVLYGGGMIFSSSRKRGFFSKVVNKATGEYFYDLYFIPLTPDAKAKMLKGKVNTRFHDGPGSVTKDGQTLFFSRSNYIDGKFRKSKEGVNKLRVLSAENNGKKWKEVTNLAFNSDEYSVTHPSISPDGKTLYFASDMPGGFGGMDIWFVTQDEKGNWSKPSNLGSRVNTAKNESFPSMDQSGVLFFSSRWS